jgi:hypothetical protein
MPPPLPPSPPPSRRPPLNQLITPRGPQKKDVSRFVSVTRHTTRECHALTFLSKSVMPAIDRVGPWAANALGATLVRAMVRLTRRAVVEIMVLLG